MNDADSDAFPGARLNIAVQQDGRLAVELHQERLLRPLSGMELSDGTLRYLLWVAALLTPRPPSLMVLNEPETSLHPDFLPALAGLIIRAAESTQVWVVSHAGRLIAALEESQECNSIGLEKIAVKRGLKGKDCWLRRYGAGRTGANKTDNQSASHGIHAGKHRPLGALL